MSNESVSQSDYTKVQFFKQSDCVVPMLLFHTSCDKNENKIMYTLRITFDSRNYKGHPSIHERKYS
jgi:hypothetical protein